MRLVKALQKRLKNEERILVETYFQQVWIDFDAFETNPPKKQTTKNTSKKPKLR